MKRNLVIILVFTVTILQCGCFGSYTVDGKSMLPRLKDGDIVLTTGDIEKMDRGDIVFFYDPIKPDSIDIARVVGLPNETLEIPDGDIYVNGEKLSEIYVSPENNVNKFKYGKFALDEHSYFLLGDNRDNSKDSRFYGAIQKGRILRKYTRTFWNPGWSDE
ncbi:MAG: signal peptidase I [Acidobacteriota bacterium]